MKAVCIDNWEGRYSITPNKKYEVLELVNDQWIYIINDVGHKTFYHADEGLLKLI